MTYAEFLERECAEMLAITKAKNEDYTGVNDDPFANFKAVRNLNICTVEQGFLTRMSDKVMRVDSFAQRGVLSVKDESVNDTLRDLTVYSILLNAYKASEECFGGKMSKKQYVEFFEQQIGEVKRSLLALSETSYVTQPDLKNEFQLLDVAFKDLLGERPPHLLAAQALFLNWAISSKRKETK